MKLTRRSAIAALTGGLAIPQVRPSWAQGQTVRVYNWDHYIGETTLADFEAETGIRVIYDIYSSSEEAEAKLLSRSSGYDVVLQTGMSMSRIIREGGVLKLDKSRLPGLANLDPELMRIADGFDPGHLYGVPYMWGSVGMTYNLDMVRERLGKDVDLSDLSVLLDPENAAKLADCGISLLDSPTDIGFMVMKYLEIDPNTAGEKEYARLVKSLSAVRPYVQAIGNTSYLDAKLGLEPCVANTWSGDYVTAKARAAEAGLDLNLGYFVPKTGAPSWFDFWVMPTDATNVEGGLKFIDFLLRPEVIAACTDYTGYANANRAATALVDPIISSNPAVYPERDVLNTMFTPAPQTNEQQDVMMRAWAAITARG